MSMSSLSAVMASPRLAPARVAFGNGDPDKHLPKVDLDAGYPTQAPLVPPAPKSIGWGKMGFAALLTLVLTSGGTLINKWRNLENTLTAQSQEITRLTSDLNDLSRVSNDKNRVNIEYTAQMAYECGKKSSSCADLLEQAKKDPDLKDIADRIEAKNK